MNNLGLKKRIMVFLFGTLLSVPAIPCNNIYAMAEPVSVVKNTDVDVDLTTESTTEDTGTDINDLNVTMINGQIVTSFDDNGDSEQTWTTIFNKYKGVILGISGIVTLTFVLILLFKFGKLGAAGDNPNLRREAINGCLWAGIAAALSGSVMLITGLFWNAFK